MKSVFVKCEYCGKEFLKSRREYNRNLKKGWSMCCSRECGARQSRAKSQAGKEVPCDMCGKMVYKQAQYLKKHKNLFCSQQCSVNFLANSRRGKKVTETKQFPCKGCGASLTVVKHTAQAVCENCDQKKKIYKRSIKTKNCIKCGNLFETRHGKYCLPCRKILNSESGLRSMERQQRRSKNELSFASQLETKLPLEMIHNTPYFTDKKGTKWDADIIIPELKLAIHWNGPWHYKEISKKIPLKRIQTRDMLKYAVIEYNGFHNYIIRDNGAASEKKVEEELEVFLKWIEDKLNPTSLQSNDTSSNRQDLNTASSLLSLPATDGV